MQLECCNFFRNILDSTEELDIETQMLVAFACMQYGLNGVIIEQLEDNKQAKALFKALKANIDASVRHQLDGRKGGRPRKNESQEEESEEGENDITTPAEEQHAGGTDVVKRGQHGNVRLSEDDYNTLVKGHGVDDTDTAVEVLDEYIEGLPPNEKRNYLRRSHRAAIERWGYRAVEERRERQTNPKVRNFIDLRDQRRPWDEINREYPPGYFDNLEKMLLQN